MGTDDVINRLRAMLDGAPPAPSPSSRYEPSPRQEEPINKEIEDLKKENRYLKRDNEEYKRQLDTTDSSAQAQIASHREILTQATEALLKSSSEITQLKLEIKDQSSLIANERQKRQAAESVSQGCKTQLSQIAREKHELEQRVKRFDSLELELKRLGEVNRSLELTNVSLRISNGPGNFHGTRATIDGLQEKAKNAELKVAKLSDQLRHVRLQNDALRIQAEDSTGKASLFYPSRGRSKSRGQVSRQSQTKQLVKSPPPAPAPAPSSILNLRPLLPLEKPQSVIKEILGFLSQHIHYIFEHLPPFIKSLIGIYRSFTYPSIKAKDRSLTSTRTRIQTRIGEDEVQKLVSEKAGYKSALKEKELEIMKLAERLEDQKKQNRAYVEQFKAQERESQRYRSKKKDRAFLKTIPIIPPTSTLLIPTPLPQSGCRDLEILSEVDIDFTDDLAQLADLTGQRERESQRMKRKKAEGRSKLVAETNRGQSRSLFDDPEHARQAPKTGNGNGSMDDLAREIRQMTTKRPDPYGDIDKAFGLDSLDTPKLGKSLVATVEDEEEPVKLKFVRKGSPINSNAERYGDAYA